MLAAALVASTQAAEFHVSPAGDDTQPGTREAPLRSLAAARDAARAFAGRERVTIHVADGTYHLPETLVFGPQDSGTAEMPVEYRAVHEGRAVISGGLRLETEWRRGENAIFRSPTPPDLEIDQLFLNGRRLRMARYPDFDPSQTTAAYQGYAADAFSPERAARWSDPAGAYIHAMHSARWGGYHYLITGKNPDGSVSYEGGWQNNRQMGMHRDFRMVENIFEELDAPGEWFHHRASNTLHLIPEPGTDLKTAEIVVVRLRHLIEFQGRRDQPVRHIRLNGFTYRHTARTFMETREPLLRSDWTIYRGGALLLKGTEDITIADSVFDQVGGNAIFVSHYNRRTHIRGCHIHDAGASGVCFVGDPDAVRNPLFEYAQTNKLAEIDRSPGPKTEEYPADGIVEDCLIHGIGRVERQPAGVQISMSRRITIRDCSIYDCARAGINISEGTWGGHVIDGCDVFDTVLETHDHGSFNSWGRDRYWASDHRGFAEAEIARDPGFPYLDAMETTIIRNSRWRCDHGWDIDLDDGSSNYEIHDNLMLAGGLKLREGFGRKAYNNILLHNGLHPHVWFENSGDQFTRNIVMAAHAPIRQPQAWGRASNHNLFVTEADLLKSRGEGGDADSIHGDPLFVDPAAGDFRVAETSPAWRIGFRNFPMDRFGVKKPSLRALAKSPVIPAPGETRRAESAVASARRSVFWQGATLRALQGEEFSAFGTRKEDGGLQVLELTAGSVAAKAGLQANDLIQRINDRPTRDLTDLFPAWSAAGTAPLELRVIRHQQPLSVIMRAASQLHFDAARESAAWKKLPPPGPSGAVASSLGSTRNDPLAVLTDGALARSYGPVFANGEETAAYKLDLRSSQTVTAVSSWSYHQDGRRARQIFSLFGSNAEQDPGWNVTDRARFTALGSLDTGADHDADFIASSLRAAEGQNLGRFRWVVWRCEPVSPLGEHTAWQEFAVETR